MEKKTLIVLQPVSEAIGTLINTLRADPTIEIQEVSDGKEAEQLLNFSAPAMLITSDAAKCVTILANCKALIKNTRSKVILSGKKVLPPKVSKKLDSLGLASYILEPITTKSLHYKVNFILKSLPFKSNIANESGDKSKTVTIKTTDAQQKEEGSAEDLAVKKLGTEAEVQAAELNLTKSQDLAVNLTDDDLKVQSKQSLSLDLINDEGIKSGESLTPFAFDDEPEIKADPTLDNQLFDDGSNVKKKSGDFNLELEPDAVDKTNSAAIDLAIDEMKAKGSLDLKMDFEDESAGEKKAAPNLLDELDTKSTDNLSLELEQDELAAKNSEPLFDMSEMEELQKQYQDPIIEKEEKDRKKNINLNLEEEDFYKKKELVEGESIDYVEFETEKKEETLSFEKKKRRNLDLEPDEKELSLDELIEEEEKKRRKKRTDLGLVADEEEQQKEDALPGEEIARPQKVDLGIEEEAAKEDKKDNLDLAPDAEEQKEEAANEEAAAEKKEKTADLALTEDEKTEEEVQAEETAAKEKAASNLQLEEDTTKEEETNPLDLTQDAESEEETLEATAESYGRNEEDKKREEGETFSKRKRDPDIELQKDIETEKNRGFEDDAGLIKTDNGLLDLNQKKRDKDNSQTSGVLNPANNNSTSAKEDKPVVNVEFLTNPNLFNPKNVSILNTGTISTQNKDIFNPSVSDEKAPIIKTHENNKELQKLLKGGQSVLSLDDLKPLDEVSSLDEYYEVYPDVYPADSNGLEFSVILLEKILNKNVDTLKILAAVSQIIFKTKMGVTSFFYLDVSFNGANNLLINHTNPQFAPYHMTEEQWIEFREFNLPRYKKAIYPTILNRKLNSTINEFVYPIFEGKAQRGFVVISFHRHIKIEDIKFCENMLDSIKNLILSYVKKTDQPLANLKSI